MKRYQLVDAEGWEQQFCSVLFESDDISVALAQQDRLSPAMNQRLGVIDTWTRREPFPPNTSPLFRTEQEVSLWLKKHQRNQNT